MEDVQTESGDTLDLTNHPDFQNTPTSAEPAQVEGTQTEQQVQTDTVADKPKFGDEDVFKVLSEKLGKEITTYDDLVQKQQTSDLEKYPQLQEYKTYLEETGRPLQDWLKSQKNYEDVSDKEVVREYLQLKYPTFTESDIQLEVQQYEIDEFEDESVSARRSLQLKKDALTAREELSKYKSQFNTPNTNFTEEQRSDLEIAKQYKEQTKSQEKLQEEYQQKLNSTIQGSTTLPLKLTEDFSIDFQVSVEDKGELSDFINKMPHWYAEDGSLNHQAVVEDSLKIKNFEKMIQLAYEQGVSKGTERVVTDAKNITINQARTTAGSANMKTNDIKITGADRMNPHKGSRMSIKGRKK